MNYEIIENFKIDEYSKRLLKVVLGMVEEHYKENNEIPKSIKFNLDVIKQKDIYLHLRDPFYKLKNNIQTLLAIQEVVSSYKNQSEMEWQTNPLFRTASYKNENFILELNHVCNWEHILNNKISYSANYI